MKKTLECIRKSPRVSTEAKFPARYSTGSKGRTPPVNIDRRNKKKGNPPR